MRCRPRCMIAVVGCPEYVRRTRHVKRLQSKSPASGWCCWSVWSSCCSPFCDSVRRQLSGRSRIRCAACSATCQHCRATPTRCTMLWSSCGVKGKRCACLRSSLTEMKNLSPLFALLSRQAPLGAALRQIHRWGALMLRRSPVPRANEDDVLDKQCADVRQHSPCWRYWTASRRQPKALDTQRVKAL